MSVEGFVNLSVEDLEVICLIRNFFTLLRDDLTLSRDRFVREFLFPPMIFSVEHLFNSAILIIDQLLFLCNDILIIHGYM